MKKKKQCPFHVFSLSCAVMLYRFLHVLLLILYSLNSSAKPTGIYRLVLAFFSDNS